MANAPDAKQWTIRALLDWTRTFLTQKGSESAYVDAQILLAHALSVERMHLFMHTDDLVPEGPRGQFREMVRRRAEGCPVAYLVGYREFYKLTFRVTPVVLIPRPETEFLLMEALAVLKGQTAPEILDLGTGSGCLAISLAHQRKDARVLAVDLSSDALALAQSNAHRHQVADRVDLVPSDLFSNVAEVDRFDVIVSNPPYIAAEEMADLPRDVREFEPHLALNGGARGLEIYTRIIAEAGRWLKPGGYLLLEIGHTQDEAVRALLAAQTGFVLRPTVRDGAKWPRVVGARWQPSN